MKLYSASIKHRGNNNMEIPKARVTAAELYLLGAIHGFDSISRIKEIGERAISDAAEFDRLMKIYGGAKLGPQVDTPAPRYVWPGVNPRLPEEFVMPPPEAKEDVHTVEEHQEAQDIIYKEAKDLPTPSEQAAASFGDDDPDAFDFANAEHVGEAKVRKVA